MTDTDPFIERWQLRASGFVVGLVLGIIPLVIWTSHKAPRRTRNLIEHCILIGTGADYHDVECPSGTWRYYGDTLRIRLHT